MCMMGFNKLRCKGDRMTREGAQRIDELRVKLYEAALSSSKLTDPHVLRISDETDRAIVDFLLKQQANKKAACE